MDQDPVDQKPAPRKLRFKPKKGAMLNRPVAPKIEAHDDTDSPEAKEMIRRMQEMSSAKPKAEKKVEPKQVAFKDSANPSYQYHGNFSSFEDKARVPKEEKEYMEPWNYYSFYPTTVPLRRPYSGPPDLLDAEEFGKVSTFDEEELNIATELGLMEMSSEPKMMFFQLPKALPMFKRASTAVSEASNAKPSSSSANVVDRPCGFNELKPGLMGKMMVYKSGAVKLKLGDTLYDVTPGSDSGFAQDAVAVDVEKKHYVTIGEISKHVILTPDIDCLLDSFANS